MTTTMHEKFDLLLEQDGDHDCEGLGRDKVCVRIVAMAELPSRFGDFHIIAFENNRDGKEHVAITKGDVIGASDVPVRLHSECLTGDALGSLRCDCRDQLETALMMANLKPENTLRFAWWAAEEQGLVGSAALLETALMMANLKPENTLRFAWWPGEE